MHEEINNPLRPYFYWNIFYLSHKTFRDVKVKNVCLPGARLLGKSRSRPIADTRAINVYGNTVLVSSKDPLHFMLAERIEEVRETKGSILKNTINDIIKKKLYKTGSI